MKIVSIEFKDGTQQDFEVSGWTIAGDYVQLYRGSSVIGFICTYEIRYLLEKS